MPDPDFAPLGVAPTCETRWPGQVAAALDRDAPIWRLDCRPEALREVCQWLMDELCCTFATLVVEQQQGWLLSYVFYRAAGLPWIHVELRLDGETAVVPSISGLANGPSADWHEREAEDLFGLSFDGHPRLGDFVLHEEWPEGVNPMRRGFDARLAPEIREREAQWEPATVVAAPGAFAMPVGPVFSDFAEAAHFRLETVGEDVIRTIPRFFYKYRGVEKIAEGQPVDRVLLLAERFSGIAAFAHGLAFCQAVEAICGVEVPPRALVLRTALAELERLRHHAAAITGICNSTALAVAASQAALIEEGLLRLSGEVARHRYLFGMLRPGGLAADLSAAQCRTLAAAAPDLAARLGELYRRLLVSSSFLDRLEEVGIVNERQAVAYGLVGPIARASGVSADIRKLFPYAAYGAIDFAVPAEPQGDGFARLRVLFGEAAQAASIVGQALRDMPDGRVAADRVAWRAGVALAAVEAPGGAAFHWLRLDEMGIVERYRITPPSFANWHGLHLAAENFAFQDFPIILASFGLSNAESDR
jgi:formate hydrogenlyase subunit 5